MKDTHEANLPTEENGKLEETKAPECYTTFKVIK